MGAGRIGRTALGADAVAVARSLLGAVLVHLTPAGRVAVRLTEVEAYAGERDPGSHAFRGRTPRTRVMFGPPGHLYVYFSYGMHWCANVVCGPDGEASAVLLRAGEVVEGEDLARARRPAARTPSELARGPARLTRAVGLDRAHDGVDLCAPDATVWLEPARPHPGAPPAGAGAATGGAGHVLAGPRVGVNGPGGDATAFPWRFWLPGEPSVSAYRPGKGRRGPTAPSGKLSAARSSGGRTTRTARTEGTAPP